MLGELFKKAKSSVIDYNGQTVRLYHRIPVPETCSLKLKWEATHSEWKQGIWLGERIVGKQSLRLTVGDVTSPSLILWEDTCPSSPAVSATAPNGSVDIYNEWDKGAGVGWSQIMGAGMLVEELVLGRKWRYRCNDGHTGTPTFTHLVFTLEIVE